MRKQNGEVLFAWPIEQHTITAGWQYSNGSAHEAVDLRAAVGAPVFAAEDGTVDWVQTWDGSTKTGNQSYGNLVRLRHEPYKGGTLQTYYAHLDSIVAVQGRTVQEGELIGFAGNTGNSLGSHLHFEVRLNGVRYNPLNWLDGDFTVAGDHVRLGEYTSVTREEAPRTNLHGIDVSRYQGVIDWQAAKASGLVDFAILRAGYGRYADQKDETFERNYAECKRLGIPVGAYWFSYAETPAQAIAEAAVFLGAVNGKSFEYPLYLDQEEARIPPAARTECAVAFLAALGGLRKGYYSFTSYMATVDLDKIRQHCDTVWLADYRTEFDTAIPRDMHQYTSSGTVPGISGRVDMNRCTRDFAKEDAHMYTSDTLKIGPASVGDRAAIRALAESLGVAVVDDGNYIIAGPMSTDCRAIVAAKAQALGLGCVDYTVPAAPEEPADPQTPATDLARVETALARLEAAQADAGAKLDTVLKRLEQAGRMLAA